MLLFFSLSMAYAGDATNDHQLAANDPQLKMSDPFEPVNRVVWYFNYNILDHYVFKPTTELYVHWVWYGGRVAVNNFVLNFNEPANMINNLLQLDFKNAADALVRFVINSTVGVLGFIDIAKMGGIERRSETFSNVLAYLHVPNGPYLMVPFLGPRSTRKLAGNIVDGLYFPLNMLSFGEKAGLLGLDAIDKREKALGQDKLIEHSLDSYEFVKQSYTQFEAFKLQQHSTDMAKFIRHTKSSKKTSSTKNNGQDIDSYLNEIN